MNLVQKISLVFKDQLLRKKIFFTVAALALFRLLASVPIPGVDAGALQRFFSSNDFLGLLNVFSGGGLSNLSIVMLGVGPYITASIIMQLLTVMSPKLKALYHEEGEAGRMKFSQYSRLLTIPLAIIQAFAFLALLSRQGILPELTGFTLITNIIVVAAGSILLMWIGELISEFGIGNGVSLIIFAGIVAAIPTQISQFVFTHIYPEFNSAILPLLIGVLVAGFLIILGVVTITEAERPIPVTYAKRVRGSKMFGGTSTYLPLRINQAGVMPIIFALSILLFPQTILGFLGGLGNSFVQNITLFLTNLMNNPYFYSSFYFILVLAFTYFYTAITFDPKSISENLQKSGAFIPGVRPGHSTAEYINKILVRIVLVGALFLGAIAVLPLIMQGITNESAFAIGGTALLIVVTVVLDLVKKVEAQISMREY